MSLEDLKKGIYRPSIDKTIQERLDYKFDNQEQNIAPKKPFLSLKIKKRIKIASLLCGILLIILICSVWLINRNTFSHDRIIVEVSGLQKIESGELLEYAVNVKNDNYIALANCVLTIEYPDNASLQNPERKENIETFSLGNISGKTQTTVTSYVKITGPEGNKAVIRATLSYLPASLDSKMEKTADFAINIVSSPFKIVIDEPKIIAINKNVTYTISFSNESSDTFENVRLDLSYPDGFVVKEFFPRSPDIGNYAWNFEKINPQEQQEIKIIGAITKNLDIINLGAIIELKNSNNTYEAYAQAFSAVSVTPAPIGIEIKPSVNVVNPGSNLELTINFENVTDSTLKDIVLTLALNGDIFEQNSVMPEDQGVYLKNSNTITWDSRRISQLALLGPFEKGSTKVTLTSKEINALSLETYNDKNFTFQARATIKPEIVPAELSGIELENSAETSIIKLNSVLKLTGDIITQSTTPLKTSGPYPPVAGEKTTYLIVWQLLNYYNDLSNIIVESSLPTGIDWEESVWPSDSNITFDPLSGKVAWQLNELKAGTGFTSPVKQMIFKVSAIPSPTQIRSKMTLLEASVASALDTFTVQNLSSSIKQLKLNTDVLP